MKLKGRRVFLTSDHHFGQESFYKPNPNYNDSIMRPEFSNVTEADAEIIRRHNEVVPRTGSIVYFLGDLAFNGSHLTKIDSMNGEWKILVMGNHDFRLPPAKLLFHFDKIAGVIHLAGKNIILSHVPVHPHELRGSKNFHGHLHRHTLGDARYFNVCLEVNDYYPTELEL